MIGAEGWNGSDFVGLMVGDWESSDLLRAESRAHDDQDFIPVIRVRFDLLAV